MGSVSTDKYPARYSCTPDEQKEIVRELKDIETAKGVPARRLRHIAKHHKVALKVVHNICTSNNIDVWQSMEPPKPRPSRSQRAKVQVQIPESKVEPEAPEQSPPPEQPADIDALVRLEADLRAEFDAKIERAEKRRKAAEEKVKAEQQEAREALEQARKATNLLRDLRHRTKDERSLVEEMRLTVAEEKRKRYRAEGELRACREEFTQLMKISRALRSTLSKVEEDNHRLFAAANGFTIDDVLKEMPDDD